MKINPILSSVPIQPVSRMKVTYITLPVEVTAYEAPEEPAPVWLVVTGYISLAILAVVTLALYA